jgi:adenine-specific DNA-methyltransferase
MIYPRLKVAKDLLSEDGVIFISIDDNEVENLQKVCNEVFGDSNFIANLIWKSKSGGANDSRHIAVDHEYVLCYAKRSNMLPTFMDKDAEVTTSYNLKDEKGEYSLDRLDKQSLGYIESLDFPIIGPDGKTYIVEHKNPNVKVARWRWSKETVAQRYKELVFKNGYVYTKNYKKEANIARSLLLEDRFGRTRTGKTDFTSMFDAAYFSAPKPIKLISYLASIINNKEAIILDFFSGSATTAHAVMQLNAEDGGKRKFIMVQLSEATDEKSEAYKAGYKNICEIGKERIRRAGKKIKEEHPEAKDLDTGFRVLKLDSSNMQDVYYTPAEFNERDLFEDNIKSDRTEEDLLFQTMIDLGIELSAKIEKTQIAGKTVWNVSDGYLMACFDEAVNETTITEIAKQQPYYFVMRDKSLANDNVADNFEQIFNHYSKDTIRRIL